MYGRELRGGERGQMLYKVSRVSWEEVYFPYTAQINWR